MDYAQQQRNPFKHLTGFVLVLLLHIVVGYAVVTGLARKVVEVVKQPFETKIVEEKKAPPPPEAPPPPPPKLVVPPPPFIPPPEIQIAVQAPANTITQVTTKTPPPAPPVVKPTPRPATPASFQRDKCSAGPEPVYPMASRRNQEAGTLVLHMYVEANGSPTKVEIQKSSGHARLDDAAKAWALTCTLKPGTLDGKPIAGWTSQQYTFTLRD
jgi:protein TonB